MPRTGSRDAEYETFTLINASLNTKCLIKLINKPASGTDDTVSWRRKNMYSDI